MWLLAKVDVKVADAIHQHVRVLLLARVLLLVLAMSTYTVALLDYAGPADLGVLSPGRLNASLANSGGMPASSHMPPSPAIPWGVEEASSSVRSSGEAVPEGPFAFLHRFYEYFFVVCVVIYFLCIYLFASPLSLSLSCIASHVEVHTLHLPSGQQMALLVRDSTPYFLNSELSIVLPSANQSNITSVRSNLGIPLEHASRYRLGGWSKWAGPDGLWYFLTAMKFL